jgi:putative hydrolase of HD superfamily
MMKGITNLLFEARILKEIPRSGFHFLGSGHESVAEHSFLTTFIGYVLSCMHSGVDELKLIQMCLLHDLAEARIGDLNYVHRRYVVADENKAVTDLTRDIPFGPAIQGLLEAFDAGETLEAQLARDADQLALILELKALCDAGYKGPETWVPHVVKRIQTKVGQDLAKQVLETASDAWWFEEKGDLPGGHDKTDTE